MKIKTKIYAKKNYFKLIIFLEPTKYVWSYLFGRDKNWHCLYVHRLTMKNSRIDNCLSKKIFVIKIFIWGWQEMVDVLILKF